MLKALERVRENDAKITLMRLNIMLYIGLHPNCTSGDLAEYFKVTLATVSRNTDALKSTGLIQRQEVFREGVYKLEYSLTPAGKKKMRILEVIV